MSASRILPEPHNMLPVLETAPDSGPLRCPAWRLTLLCIACLAPFINKAVCIDDPLFVWAADQIARAPGNFYGFNVNWYGDVKPMAEVTKNPPLWCYALSLFGLISRSEIWLHVCTWLPAIAVVLGTWKLAVAMGESPTTAAVLTLSTPVFLVCSTTLMCDVALTAGWVWAVLLWKQGLDSNCHLRLATASMLIAGTALTKYLGMALLPLLIVYTLIRSGSKRSLLWLLLPVVVLGLYQGWTSQLYGKGLLFDAGEYAVTTRQRSATSLVHSTVTTLSFFGGSLLSFAVLAHRIWKPGYLLGLIVPALAASAAAVVLPELFFEELVRQQIAIPQPIVVQTGLFAAFGLFLLAICFQNLMQHRSADNLLLLLWIVGVLIFAGGLNWTINARTLLPATPAVAIVVTRQISRRSLVVNCFSRQLGMILPGLLLGLVVAAADQQVANAGRQAAIALTKEFATHPRGLLIQGHWGFQYYAERLRARSMDFENIDIVAGDIVIIPVNNTNISVPPPDYCRLVSERVFAQPFPCSTMSNQLGTGFHSSMWGPVPFAFAVVPPERYQVFEAIKPIRKQRQPRQRVQESIPSRR